MRETNILISVVNWWR